MLFAQGLVSTVTFFRITRKIFQFGTCCFKIIVRNINALVRENFRSRCFDSDKIFKIIISSKYTP